MANTIVGMFRGGANEDSLADLKAVAAWLEQQPSNDYLSLQEAMVRVLEDMAARQPKVTPNRVLAVLELDRISGPVQSRLLKQYVRPTLSDSVHQRLWHAGDDLARWFAYTYENLFEALQERFPSQKARGQLPGVASRMFYYRGVQAKHGLFRYERWIPGKWQGLHNAYQAAVERNLARVPFSLAADSPVFERYSAEEEYLQILLLQRINTGNLNAQQIELAAVWLRGCVHMLSLSEPPLEGAGFWLDLGLGDGLLARKPHSPQGSVFYLDLAPLHKEIADGLVELSVEMKRDGPKILQAEAGKRLALLQRLEQLWRPQAKPTARRGERVEADRRVSIAAGLVEIAAALHSNETSDEVLNRRFRRGDPAEIASGRVQPLESENDSEFIEYRSDSAAGWRMHDISDSGCRLVSQSRAAAQQRLGGLLALQEEGDSRWKIGIIRRLKKASGGQIELGVEIIAQHSLLIAPKPIASRNTGYSVDGIDVSVEGKGFDALYLPPTQTGRDAPQRSMVVPAGEYAEHRRFFLNFGNSAYTVEITEVLERTKDWVWTGFELVSRAE